jgi:hypothetical protein
LQLKNVWQIRSHFFPAFVFISSWPCDLYTYGKTYNFF